MTMEKDTNDGGNEDVPGSQTRIRTDAGWDDKRNNARGEVEDIDVDDENVGEAIAPQRPKRAPRNDGGNEDIPGSHSQIRTDAGGDEKPPDAAAAAPEDVDDVDDDNIGTLSKAVAHQRPKRTTTTSGAESITTPSLAFTSSLDIQLRTNENSTRSVTQQQPGPNLFQSIFRKGSKKVAVAVEDKWEGSLDAMNDTGAEVTSGPALVTKMLKVRLRSEVEKRKTSKLFFWRPLNTEDDTPVSRTERMELRLLEILRSGVLGRGVGETQARQKESWARRKRELTLHGSFMCAALVSGLWLLLPLADPRDERFWAFRENKPVSYVFWAGLHRSVYISVGLAVVMLTFVVGLRYRPPWTVWVLGYVTFHIVDVAVPYICRRIPAYQDGKRLSLLEVYYAVGARFLGLE
ncbi:hypothetical protein HDU96_007445 [Phlyctochytrium bullatum]|nr:hypothetical protein HDU96_007445 [Phlyctochytrium bullatum]